MVNNNFPKAPKCRHEAIYGAACLLLSLFVVILFASLIALRISAGLDRKAAADDLQSLPKNIQPEEDLIENDIPANLKGGDGP